MIRFSIEWYLREVRVYLYKCLHGIIGRLKIITENGTDTGKRDSLLKENLIRRNFVAKKVN